MARIDFYIVRTGTALQVACKLAEKGYQAGLATHIQARSADQGRELDELLWSFRPNSFVPHQGIEQEIPPDLPSPDRIALLINLVPEAQDYFDDYPRVAEIVEPCSVVAGRDRYRHYRQQRHTLHNHHL